MVYLLRVATGITGQVLLLSVFLWFSVFPLLHNMASILIAKSSFAGGHWQAPKWFIQAFGGQASLWLSDTEIKQVNHLRVALGIIQDMAGESQHAIHSWRLAESEKTWAHLANIAWLRGHPHDAVFFYKRAIAIAPEAFEYRFVLARIYWPSLDRKDDAIKIYQQGAILASLKSFEYYAFEGYVNALTENWEQALTDFELAIKANSKIDNLELIPLCRQAKFAARQIGDQKSVIKFLKQAIDYPHPPQSWTKSWLLIELSLAYSGLGKADLAALNLELASALRPENLGLSHGYAVLADLYLQQESYEEAILAFQKAVSSEPQNSLYLYRLGNAYELSGDVLKAKELYMESLSLNPQNESIVLQALDRIVGKN